MDNMYYVLGMIAGMFAAIIGVAVKKYLDKNRRGKESFDERQMLVRLKGYKMSFFTMMLYNMLYAFYDLLVEESVLSTFAAMIMGIFLGALVFAVYAIWKDAYVELHRGRKHFLFLFGACGLLNLLNGIRTLEEEIKRPECQDMQVYLVNFMAAVLFGIVFLVFALKGLTEKKDEE